MKIEDMIFANRADCSGCEACANTCPRNAITMRRDAEGFAYPTINRELCIGCGKCDAVCPALNFAKKNPDALPRVFAVVNPDAKIRRHSSSGGVFSALSELVLRGGGVVFRHSTKIFTSSTRRLRPLTSWRNCAAVNTSKVKSAKFIGKSRMRSSRGKFSSAARPANARA